MANPFRPATKAQAKLRMALLGPAGSGKTYTALRIAEGLGKRIAMIDTEHGSGSKYSDVVQFDTMLLESFEPENYIEGIKAAGEAGYDVLIIDSLSHAWAGPGGLLEFVDRQKDRGNQFQAWGKATPRHNALVEAMLACKCHLIVTMRTKMEYVQEKGPDGKTTIRKVGLQPVQRDGLEYEFDVVGDLDDAILTISKTRCPALHDKQFVRPGQDVANVLKAWLSDDTPKAKKAVTWSMKELAVLLKESGKSVPDVLPGATQENVAEMVEQWLREHPNSTLKDLVHG